MAKLRRPLIDLAIGFLVPYAAATVLLLVFQSDFAPGEITFSFVLPLLLLMFPFITLAYNPIGIAAILMLAGTFFADFRFVTPVYRPYAIGLTFVAWGCFGVYSAQWITA